MQQQLYSKTHKQIETARRQKQVNEQYTANKPVLYILINNDKMSREMRYLEKVTCNFTATFFSCCYYWETGHCEGIYASLTIQLKLN